MCFEIERCTSNPNIESTRPHNKSMVDIVDLFPIEIKWMIENIVWDFVQDDLKLNCLCTMKF